MSSIFMYVYIHEYAVLLLNLMVCRWLLEYIFYGVWSTSNLSMVFVSRCYLLFMLCFCYLPFYVTSWYILNYNIDTELDLGQNWIGMFFSCIPSLELNLLMFPYCSVITKIHSVAWLKDFKPLSNYLLHSYIDEYLRMKVASETEVNTYFTCFEA